MIPFTSAHFTGYSFPLVTLGVFTRDSIPAGLDKLGFDLFSLPFIFCFGLLVADSGSWCSVCREQM